MKKELERKLKVQSKMIDVLPIYEVEDINSKNKDFQNKELKFLCVTSNAKHKNLKRLISSFLKSNFIKQEKVTLLLTIDGKNFANGNLKVQYLGHLNRDEIIRAYSESQYLVFPSLIESFGLPIIEAIKSGSNVLISNIKSLKEICKPSVLFDPYDEKDIIKAFEKASNFSYEDKSRIIVKNEINTFIKLIVNNV
jgi:glycosyltransferase involved in cell wall biosynthesis